MNGPASGFYYHYKHDPAGPVNGYAYEVLGLGHYTEENLAQEERTMVVYRPLYESFVYTNGKMSDLRPLSLFMENVEKNGVKVARFARIEDPEVIRQLGDIRERMYEK